MSPDPSALARLREIVGEEHVLADEADLAAHSRTTIPEPCMPGAVVRPGSVEEVQEILRLACVEGFSVWPCSRGKNWGYGTRTPAKEGTVVLLLERMDRILEVDEELAYAVVEPGVTYRQLDEHLKANGIRLWADCTDSTPEGSVLGNALERGVGQTPYGDHFGNLCGMEVVTPRGERIRTGGGPEGGVRTWNTYKWGIGPYIEGLFTQGNFGVVTQAGIWLMPEPECFRSYTFSLHREEDFPAMVDALRVLALEGSIQTKLHLFNDFTGLSVVTQYPQGRSAEGALTSDELADLRRTLHMPAWGFMGGLYGLTGEVRARQRRIGRALRSLGRITFFSDRLVGHVPRLLRGLRWAEGKPVVGRMGRVLTDRILRRSAETLEAAPHVHDILKGIPTDFFVRHAYFKSHPEKPDRDIDPARDGCGLMYFAPTAPMVGRQVQELVDLCRPLHEEAGFDFYAGLLMVNPRTVVVLMCLMYDRQDPEETARAIELYHDLTRVTLENGFQRYRSGTSYVEDVMGCNAPLRDFLDRLKSGVDPQGVLAPGRYGVGLTPSEGMTS